MENPRARADAMLEMADAYWAGRVQLRRCRSCRGVLLPADTSWCVECRDERRRRHEAAKHPEVISDTRPLLSRFNRRGLGFSLNEIYPPMEVGICSDPNDAKQPLVWWLPQVPIEVDIRACQDEGGEAELRFKRMEPISPTEELLEDFRQLAKVSKDGLPKVVAAFVQRWGNLGLCRHRQPINHNPLIPCMPRHIDGIGSVEPVEKYKELAELFEHLIDEGHHFAKHPPSEFYPDMPARERERLTRKEQLVSSVQALVNVAALRPFVDWTPNGLRSELVTPTTFGALVVLLLDVLATGRARDRVCVVCETPLAGRQLAVCSQPECKREANRRRVATHRLAKAQRVAYPSLCH